MQTWDYEPNDVAVRIERDLEKLRARYDSLRETHARVLIERDKACEIISALAACRNDDDMLVLAAREYLEDYPWATSRPTTSG